MPGLMNLEVIKEALAGTAGAFRCITEYQPAGGPGDKVFPPTYGEGDKGGVYAEEDRHVLGQNVHCVLLDSVQSQANRMELALLEEWEKHDVPLPVVAVDFTSYGLPKPFRISSLEAPHRIVDALIRDSELDGVPFRKSDFGKKLDAVDVRNATTLFGLCPTALVFGMWDSTSGRGALGARIQRALVSEIVGFDASAGVRTSSRIDPTQILLSAGPLYQTEHGGWTLAESEAKRDKNKNPVKVGKSGKPSEANLGNVKPSITSGGFTISKAVQTSVLSLPALRRLRFPLLDGTARPQADLAARTALAAQALYAVALVREQGADLRSRCLLLPTQPFAWELLDRPGEPPQTFDLPAAIGRTIYQQAVAEAKQAGLPWLEEAIVLKPSANLLALVRKSQELQTKLPEGEPVDA